MINFRNFMVVVFSCLTGGYSCITGAEMHVDVSGGRRNKELLIVSRTISFTGFVECCKNKMVLVSESIEQESTAGCWRR